MCLLTDFREISQILKCTESLNFMEEKRKYQKFLFSKKKGGGRERKKCTLIARRKDTGVFKSIKLCLKRPFYDFKS